MTDSCTGQLPAAGQTGRLHLSSRHREKLDALLREHLPGIEVWAYGSRVNGNSHDGSDLDLVLRAPDLQEIPIGPLTDFTEALHNSTLPFLVEARDWARLPESFHREIEQGHVVVIEKENQPAGSEWRDMPFSEAVQINPRVRLERGKTYPYVDMASINAKDRSASALTRRKYSGSGSRFQCGDTLMARITPCLENGKIARFVPTTLGSNTPAHGSTEFIIIRGRPNVTVTDFVYYLTRWNGVRNYAIDQMTGTSGRQRVPTDCFDHLLVPVPPLPEQHAIAHILGTLDDKIELNRRMNETLETMVRAVFKDWFVDFDPVRAKMEGRWRPGESLPGLPAHLYDLFPDRLVESELGEIPEGWEVGTVDKLATVVGGTTPSTKNIRYWQGGNHHWATPRDLASLSTPVLLHTERQITDAGLAKISSGLLPQGSILLSSRAPIGYLAIAEIPVAINQGFIGILPREGISNLFMLYWSKASNEEIVSYANGSTFLEINKGNFRRIPLVTPDEIVITMFDRWVRPLYECIVSNEHESRIVATIRNTLLPKLVPGEWRIGNLETLSNGSI